MKLTQFSLEINLFLFFFFIAFFFFLGFLYKRKQLLQTSDKVYDAEKELMKTNNELLAQIETNLQLSKEIEQLKAGFSNESNQDEKVKDIRLGKIG